MIFFGVETGTSVSVDRLIRVCNVEEEVFFVVFLVQRSHGGRCWRYHIVDEEEERVLWSQTDPLPDEEVELANSEIAGYEVLLLVQITNPGLGTLLHDDGDSVRILPPDLLALGSPLLEGCSSLYCHFMMKLILLTATLTLPM